MKLDGRIPSPLFIVAFVFYRSIAVFITLRCHCCIASVCEIKRHFYTMECK